MLLYISAIKLIKNVEYFSEINSPKCALKASTNHIHVHVVVIIVIIIIIIVIIVVVIVVLVVVVSIRVFVVIADNVYRKIEPKKPKS